LHVLGLESITRKLGRWDTRWNKGVGAGGIPLEFEGFTLPASGGLRWRVSVKTSDASRDPANSESIKTGKCRDLWFETLIRVIASLACFRPCTFPNLAATPGSWDYLSGFLKNMLS